MGLLGGAAVAGHLASQRHYALHTQELSTPRRRLILRSNDPSAQVLSWLSRYPESSRLLVLPQGAGLVFLSGMRSADALFSHLPMEIPDEESDTKLLQRWSQNPPDLVVWLKQDLREFGSRGFGLDYAQRTAQWLRRTYRPATDVRAQAFLLVPHARQDADSAGAR